MKHESVITCPNCCHRREETMPADACRFFYECRGCGALLKPKPGDCCMFCSFVSVPCPLVQETGSTHTSKSLQSNGPVDRLSDE